MKATYEYQSSEVEAKTRVNEANRTAQMTIYSAQAKAQAILSAKASEASALTVSLEQERLVYQNLKTALNFTSDELISWLWLSAVQSTASAQTFVVSKPATLQGAL